MRWDWLSGCWGGGYVVIYAGRVCVCAGICRTAHFLMMFYNETKPHRKALGDGKIMHNAESTMFYVGSAS